MARRLVPLYLAIAMIAGCDSNENDSFEDAPPPVLSVDAFSMDASVFGSSSKTQAGPNFVAAALRVWPVSAILSANLIIPALATAGAVQVDPAWDDAWIWSTTVTGEAGQVGLTLTATPGAQGVEWSMVVDVEGSEIILQDFELYRAQTALNGKSGTWQLYYEFEGERVNVLRADFEIVDEDTKSLVFTIVDGPFDNLGDTVSYRTDGTGREFEWIEQSQGREHLVVWDEVTHAGSITSTNYNGGSPSCWNENLDDVTCSG
jgi:hypothetical protein